MIELIPALHPSDLDRYDAVIDVRSPAEFAEDHVPGAINLWVLDDAQRADVGETYVRRAAFLARRRGAAIVARNIAGWLDTTLADAPQTFRPLIYCWRGGMRSNAMATILSAVGWRVSLLEGGYKTWRTGVRAGLEAVEPAWPVVLLDGQTGSAKTEVLRALAAADTQTIDLEALARHRGSAFGGFAGAPQPSQKLFESRLWTALARMDRGRPILVEAESRLVGRLRIPEGLWRAMETAPRIELRAPLAARVEHLVATYGDITADRAGLHQALDRLAPHHARAELEAWRALVDTGAVADLAAALIEAHYDPMYERARRKRGDAPAAIVTVDRLDAAGIAEAAARIAALAAGLQNGLRLTRD